MSKTKGTRLLYVIMAVLMLSMAAVPFVMAQEGEGGQSYPNLVTAINEKIKSDLLEMFNDPSITEAQVKKLYEDHLAGEPGFPKTWDAFKEANNLDGNGEDPDEKDGEGDDKKEGTEEEGEEGGGFFSSWWAIILLYLPIAGFTGSKIWKKRDKIKDWIKKPHTEAAGIVGEYDDLKKAFDEALEAQRTEGEVPETLKEEIDRLIMKISAIVKSENNVLNKMEQDIAGSKDRLQEYLMDVSPMKAEAPPDGRPAAPPAPEVNP